MKLFDQPGVWKDGQRVHFPFRRAEALFYIVVVKQQITREGLMELLWGHLEPEVARKNLRDTLYKVRKSLELEVIRSPQKSVVSLNPAIEIETDLPHLQGAPNPQWLKLGGSFLKGFSLKGEEAFMEWVAEMDTHYLTLLNEQLLRGMEMAMASGDYGLGEALGKRLIQLDPYHETAYGALMRLYGLQGNPAKGIALYQELEALLNRELGVKPSQEVASALKSIMTQPERAREESPKKEASFFFGRDQALQQFSTLLKDSLVKGVNGKLLIVGEAGIGKTRLKEKFIEMAENQGFLVLHGVCYQAEEAYFLKPWNGIFSQIARWMKEEEISLPSQWIRLIQGVFPSFGELTPGEGIEARGEDPAHSLRTLEDGVVKVFGYLRQRQPVVLVFDDLQWMDPGSLTLLGQVLLSGEGSAPLFLGTCRNEERESLDQFIANLTRGGLLEKIVLERFTLQEVADFIKVGFPQIPVSAAQAPEIYQATEGNPFFIIEYMNALGEGKKGLELSSRMKDILKGRFLGLSPLGRRVAEGISIFFDRVTPGMLAQILEERELMVYEALGELQRKYLIKEQVEGEQIYYHFTHQKLREFAYVQIPQGKRIFLHQRAAKLLQGQLKQDQRDWQLYSKLVYHHTHGKEPLAALEYQMAETAIYLDFSHELYPLWMDNGGIPEANLYLGREAAIQRLNEIEGLLDNLKANYGDSKAFKVLHRRFLHMKGRFLIREGDYAQGIKVIETMIQLAEGERDLKDTLKGYRQWINYGIQIHDPQLMAQGIERGLALAQEHQLLEEQGIFLRLKGLQHLMSRDLEKAQVALVEAKGIFEGLSCAGGAQYTLNIAAIENYFGEIERHRGSFHRALKYYERALEICLERSIHRGLGVFYTNGGKAALELKNLSQARDYFQKALENYRQFDLVWGRAVAEGYMAWFYAKEHRGEDALQALKLADHYSQQLQNPYEVGLICGIKGEISQMLERGELVSEPLKGYLSQGSQYYFQQGILQLELVGETYEIKRLKEVEKQGGLMIQSAKGKKFKEERE